MKPKSDPFFAPAFTTNILDELQSRLIAKGSLDQTFDYYGSASDVWNMMAGVFCGKAQKHFAALEHAGDTKKLLEFDNGNQAALIALKDEHAIVVTYINPSLQNSDMQHLIFVALKEVDAGERPTDGYKAVAVCSVPGETVKKLHKRFGTFENLHAALAQTILSDKNWPSKLMRNLNPSFGPCIELGPKAFDIELSTVSAYVDNSERNGVAFCNLWNKKGDNRAAKMLTDPDRPMLGSPADLEIASFYLTQISEKLPKAIAEYAIWPGNGPRP